MKTWKLTLLLALGFYANNALAQTEQPALTNQEIVETFLSGFNDPEKIPASLALLADDYQFKNPMVELHSKAEFIALAQEIGKVVTGIEVQSIAANGEWVATFYVFKSNLPGMERNQASEWFRIQAGVIVESIMVYDASAWRKVYAEMGK